MTDPHELQLAVESPPRPLLSICIPTCNRAHFLRVMLQALLPQVQECGSKVEVWVLDNASSDETAQILEQAHDLGPFVVYRQTENVGPTRNIVQGPAKLARGEYTWVLGDHNLMRPGALRRVLQFVEAHRSFAAIYVNFRCASYPNHWPETAVSGYDGDFGYLGNTELTMESVDRWTDLLRPYSAACTQNYAHIVRTSVWQDYWEQRTIGRDYADALTTYPHTVTLLHSVGRLPAAVIMDPAITIFNGAQSWGDPETRFRVYFLGFTDLLRQLTDYGVSRTQVRELTHDFFSAEARHLVRVTYERLGRAQTLRLLAYFAFRNWHSLGIFAATFPAGMAPTLCQRVECAWHRLRNYRNWYIYNIRPARWLRARGWLD